MVEKLEAVIFDYDGTIVDSEQTYFKVMDILVEKYSGRKMEKIDYIRNVSGTSVEQCKKYITTTYNISNDDYDVLEEDMRVNFADEFKKSPVLPFIKEVFNLLKENNIKVGVASNGNRKHIESGLKEHGLFDKVDDIITKYDVERGKPWPDIYLESANRLGVNIKNCVAVEDSRPGALAAAASGAYLVLQTNEVTKHFDFSDVEYKERDCNLYEFIKTLV